MYPEQTISLSVLCALALLVAATDNRVYVLLKINMIDLLADLPPDLLISFFAHSKFKKATYRAPVVGAKCASLNA